MRIALCGSNRGYNESTERELCENLGCAITKSLRINGIERAVFSTGGTGGSVKAMLRGAKKELQGSERPQIEVFAYSPMVNETEWDEYERKGIVPSRDIYDKIIWSPLRDRKVEERGLARIPELIQGSNVMVACV